MTIRISREILFFQFRASRYIICPNRTSEWNFMIIRIFRELPLFNFELQDELCLRIRHPMKSYDHLNFSRAFVVQFLASRYIIRLNWTSEWKVVTIWISLELRLFNLERLDILCALIEHPSEKLCPFELLKSFRCSLSSVSIYYAPES